MENILKYLDLYSNQLEKYNKALLYYNNQNDILRMKSPTNQANSGSSFDPFRNADNRISHNWFNILVNQKAGFMFAFPPIFDSGDKNINNQISKTLGAKFARVCKDLCINASLYGVSYLHFWSNNGFNYGVIDSKQIIPIYKDDLNNTLKAVIRIYEDTVLDKETLVYEYWDNEKVDVFYENNGLKPYFKFENNSNTYYHNMKSVPFVEFRNNNLKTSDLINVKSLIDVYDKIFSGFVNDVEDVQQVILVLTNYGGEDLQTFLADLKRYKAIGIEKDDTNDASGLSTMSIDIPIEARSKVLEITRKQIFVSGLGVDPEINSFGNTSGVALKHLYGLLELKCGLLETEFKSGFYKLISVILRYLKLETLPVEQIFTRDYIQDDLEKAEVLSKVSAFTSRETLAKNNPLVEDFETEINNLKGENYARET